MGEEQEVIDSFTVGNEVSAILNRIKSGPNTPLRIVVLTRNFDKNFSFIIENLKNENITFSLNTENKSHILWDINIKKDSDLTNIECPNCKNNFNINQEDKTPIKNFLVEYLDSNLLVLITNERDSLDMLINFFNYLYPVVSRTFYRAAELKTILNRLGDIKDVEVSGRECVVKRLYEDKKTIVTYEEDTVDGFFQRAKKENGWIDSIEVAIKPLGIIRFSRKGVILYSRPFNFTSFFDIIVGTIVKEILEKRRVYLSKKSRSRSQPEIRPITMQFDSEYFSDEENITKLVKRLNESSKYEVSVLYQSPGLAHIEVYDYANGGGFDIYINSTNNLRIVPQTQATETVLEAAILKISDIFEGNVQ